MTKSLLRPLALTVGALLLFWTSSHAAGNGAGQPHDFGVGAILGDPTGLSMKYWLGEKTAIDGAVAWHVGENSRVQFHIDHLWHIFHTTEDTSRGRLPFYVGVGLRATTGHDADGAVRLPIGLTYLFGSAPFDLFAEVVPNIEFTPDTRGSVSGAVGLRYYFRTS